MLGQTPLKPSAQLSRSATKRLTSAVGEGMARELRYGLERVSVSTAAALKPARL